MDRKHPYIDGNRIFSCFNLTEKGFCQEVKKTLGAEGGSLKSDSILHDLKLNDIRRFFLSKECVDSYFTENELVVRPDLKSI